MSLTLKRLLNSMGFTTALISAKLCSTLGKILSTPPNAARRVGQTEVRLPLQIRSNAKPGLLRPFLKYLIQLKHTRAELPLKQFYSFLSSYLRSEWSTCRARSPPYRLLLVRPGHFNFLLFQAATLPFSLSLESSINRS